jgi:hypothetical protein
MKTNIRNIAITVSLLIYFSTALQAAPGDTLFIFRNAETGRIVYVELADSNEQVLHKTFDQRGRLYECGHCINKKQEAWQCKETGTWDYYDTTGFIYCKKQFTKKGKYHSQTNYHLNYSETYIRTSKYRYTRLQYQGDCLQSKETYRRCWLKNGINNLKFETGLVNHYASSDENITEIYYDTSGNIVEKTKYFAGYEYRDQKKNGSNTEIRKYGLKSSSERVIKVIDSSGKRISHLRKHGDYHYKEKIYYDNGSLKRMEKDGYFSSKTVQRSHNGRRYKKERNNFFMRSVKDWKENGQRHSVRRTIRLFGKRYFVFKYWSDHPRKRIVSHNESNRDQRF